MEDVYSLYRKKLTPPEKAVSVVKSGQKIFLGEFIQGVEVFDEALSKRKSELKDVILTTVTRVKPLKCVEVDPKRDSFI